MLWCILIILLVSPAKVLSLELLELLLCEHRLGLLGCLLRPVPFIPGLPPCIVPLDLSVTERKTTLFSVDF